MSDTTVTLQDDAVGGGTDLDAERTYDLSSVIGKLIRRRSFDGRTEAKMKSSSRGIQRLRDCRIQTKRLSLATTRFDTTGRKRHRGAM